MPRYRDHPGHFPVEVTLQAKLIRLKDRDDHRRGHPGADWQEMIAAEYRQRGQIPIGLILAVLPLPGIGRVGDQQR